MVSTAAATSETGELIKPDEKFIREVVRRGGDSVKKCFQCGTCSVTCNIPYAREGSSFPRRLILWTQWGLKDKVLRDPAIWLCHQCNDCSANCPRGAKPGDTLAAVRSIAVERFTPLSFISRLFADPRYLPVVFGIPAVILLALVAGLRGLSFPGGEIEYDRFISSRAVEIAASIVAIYAVVVAALGVLRFWTAMKGAQNAAWASAPSYVDSQTESLEPTGPSDGPGAMAASLSGPGLPGGLASTAGDVAMHSSFRQCETDRLRLWGHLALFYGAPLLLVATGIAAIYTFIGAEVQRPPSDAAKIFGNLGGLLVFLGVGILTFNRLQMRKGTWGRGRYVDWFLLALILLLVVTGASMEVARYAGSGSAAYSLYMVHLVLVFSAFVYAPHGKFAHSFYRPAAMVFARLWEAGGSMLAARRLKATWQGLLLAILMGLLAWHTISWHMDGQHGELFEAIGETWWDTTKAVGYYVGLMAATGTLLGLFMERLTDFIGYEVKKIEHFKEGEDSIPGD